LGYSLAFLCLLMILNFPFYLASLIFFKNTDMDLYFFIISFLSLSCKFFMSNLVDMLFLYFSIRWQSGSVNNSNLESENVISSGGVSFSINNSIFGINDLMSRSINSLKKSSVKLWHIAFRLGFVLC